MTRRMIPVLAAVLAVTAATGCGPNVGLVAGVQTQSTSLLLGTPATAAIVGPSAAPPVPSFPGLVVPPSFPAPRPPVPTGPVVPPAPRPVACPAADPLTFPAVPATRLLTSSPHPGTYSYRQVGTSAVDAGKPIALARQSSWVVAPAKTTNPAQSYAFTVTHPSFGGATVSTTYAVVPPAADAVTVPGTPAGTPPVSVQPPGGLYITTMVTRVGATTSTFSPTGPGVEVFSIPAKPSDTWQSEGTDPNTAVSMSVSGTTDGDVRVNACGTKLDAWHVTLTATILGVDENLTQTEHLALGTEYGGLVLSDTVSLTGTFNGHAIDQHTSATINSITPRTRS